MPVVEIRVPSVGESVTEVTVASFLVEDGDIVAMDDPLCELESDKATMELPAEVGGKVKFTIEEGDDLNIGDLVCTIDTDAASSSDAPVKNATPASNKDNTDNTSTDDAPPAAPQEKTYATGHAAPAVAKLMAENNLTANDITGTGPDGRIIKEDVLKYLESNKQATSKTEATPKPETEGKKTSSPRTSSVGGNRSERREKMSRLRKTISRRLVEAKNNTAMLTTFNEVDLTEVIAIRKQYKELFKEKHGINLGYMSFFTKAAAMALLDYPAVNAYIADEQFIEYHDYVDISIAVSTPKGLVVPVIRNAELLTMEEVEKEVKNLALKGRDGKLTMEDMTGGTFTITNGGIFGSLQSTPIINPPQSAILGMHKIQQRPMVVNGEIVARPMMYLALSYDHRIVDGKEAVSFLVRIKELLEEPMKLFLNI